MKSILVKFGLITALTVSLFNGKASAEVNTDWATKCGEISQNQNPSFQQINCLLTYAAINADIPPEVVKGVAWKESDWRQFVDGKPNVSFDGGIGIMQITNQPRYDQQKLQNDIAYNIQAGVEILNEKYSWSILPKIKDAGRHIIENWYFPVMAYNGIVPANSPLKKADGSVNSDAYQEKVFRIIEQESYLKGINDPAVLAKFPFSTSDFDYDPTKSDPIKFLVPEYTVNGLHESPYFLKNGELAITTTNDVKLRPQPNTTLAELEKLPKYTNLTIIDGFKFDTSNNQNQFVWFKVKKSDGRIGYVTSAYITKKNDLVNPIVTGVANGKYYNKDVKIHFNEGYATLNNTSIKNDYLVSKEGNYTLVVKDAFGNTTTIKFTIDKKAPAMPSVSTVSDQMTKVTGKTEAYATVKLSINAKYVKSVVAASNGSFQIPISKQKSGTKISVTATDKANNVSVSKTVTVIDKTPPAKPIVNPVTSKSTYVTGTAEKGATVYVYRGSTRIASPQVVPTTGKFGVKIAKQKTKTVLRVYAVDKAGNKSADTLVTVR
jgi:Bacterial Ig domain/Transglycosylase SLT domain